MTKKRVAHYVLVGLATGFLYYVGVVLAGDGISRVAELVLAGLAALVAAVLANRLVPID